MKVEKMILKITEAPKKGVQMVIFLTEVDFRSGNSESVYFCFS